MAATTSNENCISLEASTGYTTKQYYAMDVNTSGKAVLCSAAGQRVVGLCVNAPASGAQMTVQVGGVGKWLCGAAGVTAGDSVTTDANGLCATANKADTDTQSGAAADALVGSNVFGIAKNTATSGQIVEVIIQPVGAIPTTAD